MPNVQVIDGDFVLPSVVSPVTRIAPFADNGDHRIYVVEEDMEQLISEWSPLETGTPKTFDGQGFILASETPVQPVGGGIGRWTRRYARVPRRQLRYESFNWRRPGLTLTGNSAALGISGTPTSASGITTITTSIDHDYVPGDTITIAYMIRFSGATAPQIRYETRKVLSKPALNKVTVALITEQVTQWMFVRIGGARAPETVVRTSRIEADYFLTEVKGAQYLSAEEIPIVAPFVLYNSAMEEIDTVSSTTDPTITTYKGYVRDAQWLVAEASIIRPWMPPIYERSTRFVKAE